MRMLNTVAIGKAAIVIGAALIMYAVAGASVVTYPEYATYYYSAGAGITMIIAGLLLAVKIEDARQSGDKQAC
jgi:uncharacterized membrane protein HdeD (DUF308 family)